VTSSAAITQRRLLARSCLARVIPADDTYGAAAAVLAHDLGLGQIFVKSVASR
jgi:hypothetical protein